MDSRKLNEPQEQDHIPSRSVDTNIRVWGRQRTILGSRLIPDDTIKSQNTSNHSPALFPWRQKQNMEMTSEEQVSSPAMSLSRSAEDVS